MVAADLEPTHDEIFDLGLIGREEATAPASERKRAPQPWTLPRRRRWLVGLGFAVFALATIRLGASIAPSGDGDGAPQVALDPTLVASVDPAFRVLPDGVTAATLRAREELTGNVGVAVSFCNGMAKHFDETPEQVARAQRYADCLAGFDLDLRLPTSTLHHGYGISSDLEPALVLHCGSVLTGPDVSEAAMAEFERCVADAEVLFGLEPEA